MSESNLSYEHLIACAITPIMNPFAHAMIPH